MGVDGLMSDQLFIEQNSELVTDILMQVQEEEAKDNHQESNLKKNK